jgi:hypothetical protein
VTIQERRLNKLNYESPKINIDELLADTSVLAEIKGEKPITVGDLTEALNLKHYHGLDKAATTKKVNAEKRLLLLSLIDRKIISKEALARGIDKGEEYQSRLRTFKNSTLFGMFIERVVVPNVNVMESDLKAYFEAHKGDYVYPEMMKLTSLVFGNKRDAESTLKSLRKGADIDWVRANATGLVATADDDPLSLHGRVLALKALPEDMHTVLAGAHAGDFRLYEGTEGRYYVLSVQEVIPPSQQPYEEVREKISASVLHNKINEAVEGWFLKLRAASDIKVYLSDTAK